MKKMLLFLIPLVLAILACGFPQSQQPQPTQDVSAIVNATLTAVAQSEQAVAQPSPTVAPTLAETASATPTLVPAMDFSPPVGIITGRLSYPSSFIPSMRVAFTEISTGQVSYMDTAENQGTYSMELPAGTYYVIAYPYSPDTIPAAGDPVYAGGYTQFVLCGLSAECSDHTLVPVTVIADQTVTADPADWYAPVNTFPPMPN
ncbi:MAG: hypothetical protein U0Z26_15220 [Anaerolineales bacterium]